RTTSPNSKGIVDVVFRIAPNRGKGRSTRGRGGAGERPLLLARADEIDKIFDLGDALGGQSFDLSDQGLRIASHGWLPHASIAAFYQAASPWAQPVSCRQHPDASGRNDTWSRLAFFGRGDAGAVEGGFLAA